MKRYSRDDYAESCLDPDRSLPESDVNACIYDENEQRCFSCNVRSVQISPSATPSRRNTLPPTVNPNANAIERGILRDERGVPIRENGKVIGLKTYRDDKRRIDSLIRKAKAPEAPADGSDRHSVTTAGPVKTTPKSTKSAKSV